MSSLTSPKRLVIATVPKSSIKNSSGVTTIRLPEIEGKSTRPSNRSGQRPLKVALPRHDTKAEKRIFIHVAPEIDIKQEDDEVIFDDEVKSNGPVRKRQRLDHLSFEQKLLRRKLKNRVAAQSARDKKKAKMDELEIIVKSLEKQQTHLADQNKLLHKGIKELQAENKELKEELKKRFTAPACVECSKRKAADDMDTMSSSFPASPSIVRDKVVSTPIRSAESINVPQQKEQAVRMALFLIMHGAMWAWTVTGILCLMPIAYQYSISYKQNCSAHSANRLPVKKRFPDKWWGNHQKGWNPVDGMIPHK